MSNTSVPPATNFATKAYVDAVAQGLHVLEAVKVSTTAAITPDGSSAEPTIINNSNGAISIDGEALAVNDRVLVKDQSLANQNGIYKVSVQGDGSTKYQLTRADDFDSLTDIKIGDFVFVTHGTSNGGNGFVMTGTDTFDGTDSGGATLGTTNITFTQFSSSIGASDNIQLGSLGVGVNPSSTTGDITFTNVLKAPAGSNSAPSIAYSSDTDTGFYFGSAKVAVTVSGTEEVAVGTNGMQLASSLGVGTSASGTTGEIRATNDITAFYSSDKRLKDNITPITEPLSKLSQLGGYTFDWIPKEGIHSHEGRDVGVIAQEVEEVLPEVTTTRNNGYKAVKYEKIVPLLIECIKAQQSQIDELKETLYELKK